MRKTSARFELHSAAKMRIEDLFVDAQCETDQYKQIGNSVPPPFAYCIAQEVMKRFMA